VRAGGGEQGEGGGGDDLGGLHVGSFNSLGFVRLASSANPCMEF
jgi:hypothetical protein